MNIMDIACPCCRRELYRARGLHRELHHRARRLQAHADQDGPGAHVRQQRLPADGRGLLRANYRAKRRRFGGRHEQALHPHGSAARSSRRKSGRSSTTGPVRVPQQNLEQLFRDVMWRPTDT